MIFQIMQHVFKWVHIRGAKAAMEELLSHRCFCADSHPTERALSWWFESVILTVFLLSLWKSFLDIYPGYYLQALPRLFSWIHFPKHFRWTFQVSAIESTDTITFHALPDYFRVKSFISERRRCVNYYGSRELPNPKRHRRIIRKVNSTSPPMQLSMFQC